MDTRRRLLEWFSRFVDAHPEIPEERQGTMFICYLRAEVNEHGNRVRNDETIRDYGELVRRYNMTKSRVPELRARLEAEAFSRGLRECAKTHFSSRENVMLDGLAVAWPAVGPAQRAHWKAACYLLIATGCRAKHISRIRSLRFSPEGLYIRWFTRKIREGGNNEWLYQYDWSFSPTEDVLELLRSHWKRFLDDVGDPDQIASRIDAYIRALCQERGYEVFTTRYYRCRLSTILAKEVKAHQLSEAEFEMLLDHETRTCFQRYMLPGDVESLLYTGHQKPPPKKKGRKTSK